MTAEPSLSAAARQALEECAFFRSLSPGELRLVSAMAEERHVPTGHEVYASGTVSTRLYLVVDGWLHVAVRPGDRGSRLFGAGDIVGLSTLVGPHRYMRAATATSDLHVIALPADALRELMDADDSIGRRLWREVARTSNVRLLEMIAIAAEVGPPEIHLAESEPGRPAR